MRAAMYTRISKDMTGQGDGVARQRQEIENYCQQRGWEIVREYEDNDMSATNLKKARPDFEQMLRDVAAGSVDVIVAKHMDRLLRRITELERVLTVCEQAGAYIVTTSDGVDTSSDGGRLVARILASVAQGEMERKGARQKAAHDQRAERGIGWGPRAFGYTEKSEGDKIIPAEAEAIREAYATILAGGSLYSIAQNWNQRGMRTTKGNEWSGMTVRSVLLNPRYAGLCAHRDEIVGPSSWDAIIDRETWEGVQAVLTNPSRKKSDTRSRGNLLSAIARCGACGKYVRYGGSPERRMYVCKTAGCYKVARTAAKVDEYITRLIVARLSKPDAIELMTPQESQHEMRDMLSQQRGLREKRQALAVDWADGTLTADQLRAATQRINQRLEQIDKTIFARSANRVFTGIVGAENVEAVWDALPLERKRTIIKTLCRDIIIIPIGKGGKAANPGGIKVKWRTIDGGKDRAALAIGQRRGGAD